MKNLNYFAHITAFMLGSSITSIVVRLQGSMSTQDIAYPIVIAITSLVGFIFAVLNYEHK